jgi:hypothetical protein
METTRTAAAAACLALGLAILPSAGQEEAGASLHISRQALVGRWEGRSGTITVTVTVEPKTVAVRMGEPPNNDGPAGGLPLTDFAARYTVCRRCNEVRIRGLGRGHLAEGGRLVLTLGAPRGRLPKGAVLTLTRLSE